MCEYEPCVLSYDWNGGFSMFQSRVVEGSIRFAIVNIEYVSRNDLFNLLSCILYS